MPGALGCLFCWFQVCVCRPVLHICFSSCLYMYISLSYIHFPSTGNNWTLWLYKLLVSLNSKNSYNRNPFRPYKDGSLLKIWTSKSPLWQMIAFILTSRLLASGGLASHLATILLGRQNARSVSAGKLSCSCPNLLYLHFRIWGPSFLCFCFLNSCLPPQSSVRYERGSFTRQHWRAYCFAVAFSKLMFKPHLQNAVYRVRSFTIHLIVFTLSTDKISNLDNGCYLLAEGGRESGVAEATVAGTNPTETSRAQSSWVLAPSGVSFWEAT